MIKDHQGNEFSSVEEMANHYGLDAHKLFERLQVFWWPVERALTENIDSIRKVEKAVKKIEHSVSEYVIPEGAQSGTLAYERPDLLEEWDYEKNNELGLDPTKLLVGGWQKANWICKKCKYKWPAIIYSRTGRNKTGCPACSNKVVTATNNLQYLYPDVALEFNIVKNNITPDKVLATTSKQYWFVCSTCGHEWRAIIYNRTTNRQNCPNCRKGKTTSFPEQAIYYFIHKYFKDAINKYTEFGFELDIYVPSKNIAIEYDGAHWHSSRHTNDINKTKLCNKHNIELIRIRENGLPPIDTCKNLFISVNPNYNDLNIIINILLKECFSLNIAETIDVASSIDSINKRTEYSIVSNSLQQLFPHIAKEFMSDKNGITPEKVAAKSGKKYWWKCKTCKHEWLAKVAQRTTAGTRCPECAKNTTTNYRLSYLRLDLTYSDLAKEVNEERTVCSVSALAAGSDKKIWWTCNNCKQDYDMRIRSRTNRGAGCPHCGAGRHPEFRKQRRYIDEQGNLVIEEKE